jgi:hypothetical protein
MEHIAYMRCDERRGLNAENQRVEDNNAKYAVLHFRQKNGGAQFYYRGIRGQTFLKFGVHIGNIA